VLYRKISSYKTLLSKETKRFLRVYHQTIISPLVSALLFYHIFALSISKSVPKIAHLHYETFVAAGLIAMSVIQNSFANSSSTILISKVNGAIIDYLIPPFTSNQIIFCINAASFFRCALISVLSLAVFSLLAPLHIHDIFLFAYYILVSSLICGLIGTFAGIYSRRFDDMAAITNYVVTPLSFLSGTFYSAHNLEGYWKYLVDFNPFFYMVDGIRYSITGYSEASIESGAIFLLALCISLWIFVYVILATGWKLRK